MNTNELATRFRQVLAEHEHGALGGIDLAEALAQAAVAALNTPDEGAVAAVINRALDDWRGEERSDVFVARAILAAYPVLTAAQADALWAELEQVRGSADPWWAEYDKAETERQQAVAVIERVRAVHFPLVNSVSALCPKPECNCGSGNYDECPTIAALDGAPAPEDVWEYGYELIEPDDRNVFEREGDFISAAFAYRAAKKRIHEERHPNVPTLQYALIRRRKAGPWEPVESEKP